MVRIQVRLFWSVSQPLMKWIIAGLFVCLAGESFAQYFQFSQYNFTPHRINPALVASSDYASLSFVYRNQGTDGGFHLSSNSLNASYPLVKKNGGRWSGIGLSFMDDRSGKAGLFNTQEVGLSYAVNVDVAKFQSVSLGVRALYKSSKFNLDGLYTGSQYIPDRGFDESISSGESLGQLTNGFMTFAAGLYWQQTDRLGNTVARLGFSFFDINKPEDSFLEPASQLNTTSVAEFSFRIYQKGNMGIYPEILYTRSAANNVVNAGAVLRCDLESNARKETPHVDLIAKYVFGRSGILGFQYHNEVFSLGFTYDFPMTADNVANTGAFEIGLALRKLVVKKKGNRDEKDPKAAQNQTGQKPQGKKLGATVGVKKPPAPKPAADTSKVKTTAKNEDMSTRLRQKQDSVITAASAGNVKHEPLILEKATLHFNFEFNSTTLDEETTDYLDELAKALIDNPELKIKLVGHTDNVGSEKFNQRLSINRAQTLKDYLVEKGVDTERIAADGKGMKEPLNKNETEKERARNRRVELTILYDQ
ncbi:MAG TPA: PorP/SprF family type IX secretion system membrane protein [Chryseolinea sp.]